MFTHWIVAALFVMLAAERDETIRAYGGAGHVWTLHELDGAPFSADATLTFPEAGFIAGSGPCNSYRATLTAPFPWFGVGPILATKRACTELSAEAAFFDALRRATISEATQDTLRLSNDDGLMMVFTSGG